MRQRLPYRLELSAVSLGETLGTGVGSVLSQLFEHRVLRSDDFRQDLSDTEQAFVLVLIDRRNLGNERQQLFRIDFPRGERGIAIAV